MICICCDPWEGYVRWLVEQNELDRLEWDREQDVEHEAELARAEAYGESDCPWPWYADPPIEVQEPVICR